MTTRSPRSVNRLRARSATALKLSAAATSNGSPPRRAVRRRQEHGLPAHGLLRHLARRGAEFEALDLLQSPLAGQHDAVLLEIGGQAHDLFRAGGRHDGLGSGEQRAHDRAGGPEYVNDDDRSAGEIPRIEAEWRMVNVDLHVWSLRSCGSRSRNFVSTLPATKSGWR